MGGKAAFTFKFKPRRRASRRSISTTTAGNGDPCCLRPRPRALSPLKQSNGTHNSESFNPQVDAGCLPFPLYTTTSYSCTHLSCARRYSPSQSHRHCTANARASFLVPGRRCGQVGASTRAAAGEQCGRSGRQTERTSRAGGPRQLQRRGRQPLPKLSSQQARTLSMARRMLLDVRHRLYRTWRHVQPAASATSHRHEAVPKRLRV